MNFQFLQFKRKLKIPQGLICLLEQFHRWDESFNLLARTISLFGLVFQFHLRAIDKIVFPSISYFLLLNLFFKECQNQFFFEFFPYTFNSILQYN